MYAGEIGGMVGQKKFTTGDTICAEADPIVLENIEFPEPVISMAIEPKTTADKDTMVAALQDLVEEDPTFHTTINERLGRRSSKEWVSCIWRSSKIVFYVSIKCRRMQGSLWWRIARVFLPKEKDPLCLIAKLVESLNLQCDFTRRADDSRSGQ